MSHIGRNTYRLAHSDHPTTEERAAIRASLGPIVESLRHDLALIGDALKGPDPEYALSVYLDLVHEAPGRLHALEDVLAASRRLRVAA